MSSAVTEGPDGPLVAVGPPRTLRANLWATGVWCALTVLSNVVLFGQRSYERRQLIELNNKAKSPKKPYGGAVLEHDLHNVLWSGLIVSVLVSAILLLLAALTWRGRRWARWLLLILAILPLPFGIGVIDQLVLGTLRSLPGLYKVTVILAGFAAVTVAVLLLHRTTRQYFGALRETQRGQLPAVPGSRPPGVRRPGGGMRGGGMPGGGMRGGGMPGGGVRGGGMPGGGVRGGGVRGGGLSALFVPRRRPAPGASSDAAGSSDEVAAGDPLAGTPTAEPGSGGTASRRAKPTRPGSVKPKSTGARPGRTKSRQQ